jgi:mono/diheme cytochrome c family protein
MNKFLAFVIMVVLLAALAIALLPAEEASALPEYASQVGEPCSTCHISPSGGGSRTPRGQAWVGGGKPGEVPDLMASLELLGVHLEVDETDFTQVPDEVPPAQPLQTEPDQMKAIHDWLADYAGN